MIKVNPIVEVKISEDSKIHLGSFKGAFCKFQTAAYGDLVRGGLDKPVAHKVAMDYASDIGRACATDGKFASSVGKAKEGQGRLKISGSSLISVTRTMSVVRVAQAIGDLADEGLLASRELPPLNETLVEYLGKCEEWCDEEGPTSETDETPIRLRNFTEKKD